MTDLLTQPGTLAEQIIARLAVRGILCGGADEREQIRAEAARQAREAHNHFNATRGLTDEHSQC